MAEVFAGSGELGRHSLHARLGYQLGSWRIRLADGHIYHVLGPAQLRNTTIVDAVVRHQFDFIQGQLSFNLMNGIIPINPTGKGKEDFIYQGLKLGELPPDVPFINPTLDADVQLTWSFFEGNLLIAGGNYRWIALFSDETLPGEVHQHRIGVFIHDEQLVTENLILTGSVRFDYNSITPFTFSPRLAGVYGLAENHFVRLAFAQAFRKPSFFNSSIHVKNVEAEPAFPEFVDFFNRVLGNPLTWPTCRSTTCPRAVSGSVSGGTLLLRGPATFPSGAPLIPASRCTIRRIGSSRPSSPGASIRWR